MFLDIQLIVLNMRHVCVNITSVVLRQFECFPFSMCCITISCHSSQSS